MEVFFVGFLFVALFGLVIAGFVFWILMLVEVVQIPEGWFTSGTKTTWILLCALLGWLGAIIYFFAARPDKPTRDWLRQMRHAGYQPLGPNAPAAGYPPPYGPGPGPGYGPPPTAPGPGYPPEPPSTWS